MKTIVIDNGNNQRMYECTYNGELEQMYFDVYEKTTNLCIPHEDLIFEVNDVNNRLQQIT